MNKPFEERRKLGGPLCGLYLTHGYEETRKRGVSRADKAFVGHRRDADGTIAAVFTVIGR